VPGLRVHFAGLQKLRFEIPTSIKSKI